MDTNSNIIIRDGIAIDENKQSSLEFIESKPLYSNHSALHYVLRKRDINYMRTLGSSCRATLDLKPIQLTIPTKSYTKEKE